MVDLNTKERRITKLCQIYRSKPQIGLVLGAGVSCGSDVPLYLKMALDLYKHASKQNLLPNAPSSAVTFLDEQAELLQRKDDGGVARLTPEEIVLFIKTYLADKDPQVWLKLVKKVLYANVEIAKSHKMVGRETIKKNDTLVAVICFCAALPGSTLALESPHRIETNPKVGGILTTNYDYLVEGSFGSKFGRSMLKPVGRSDARESLPGRRVIPVYHIHGYVSYVPPKDDPAGVKGSEELVIAEDDYLKTFYEPLGFCNYIAMSFFRRFPCLFIGSSMTDMNIRRFLYHHNRERDDSPKSPNHFAILKTEGTLEDDFKDAILSSYRVSTIWIQEFEEIGEILERVYTSEEGVTQKDWEALKIKWWSDR